MSAAVPPYFSLFACCLPVRGAARSVICDVQRGALIPISNALYDLLRAFREQPVAEVLDGCEPAVAEVVRRNLAGLVEKELGFWCDDPAEFPDLDLGWDRPAAVTNAIVELSPFTAAQAPRILAQLEEMGCQALELRSYRPFPLAVLRDVLGQLDGARLSSVDLILCYSTETTVAALEELGRNYVRVNLIVVHSAPRDLKVGAGLEFQAEAVTSADHCGFVDPQLFAVNVPMFTESQSCNTCLNRKVAVDEGGHIRNCPAMPETYGRIDAVSLREATARADFRAWWTVTKNDVEVCRDCEFRHVCTDCRALRVDPANRLSKPRNCRYDPYAARWENDRPAPAAAAP
jgi:SPASM domain peptide maturase of grasp-with-spasm system